MPDFTQGRTAGLGLYDSSTTYRNISSYLNSIEYNLDADTADVTTFNSSNDEKSYVPGFIDGTMSVEGYWDPTIDGYLNGVLSKKKYLLYFPQTTDKTSTTFVKYKQYGICTKYSPGVSVDEPNKFSAEFQMVGARVRSTTTG